jgi:hypothetical protein
MFLTIIVENTEAHISCIIQIFLKCLGNQNIVDAPELLGHVYVSWLVFLFLYVSTQMPFFCLCGSSEMPVYVAESRLFLADRCNMVSSVMYMVFCGIFYSAVSIQAWDWQRFDNVRAAITHNARLRQLLNILTFEAWPLLPYWPVRDVLCCESNQISCALGQTFL